MDWANKDHKPPDGAVSIYPDVGPELVYWPIPPFDINKDGIHEWVKWKDTCLSQGDNIRILTTIDSKLNLNEWELDWSIGSYTNTVLWEKRLVREKARAEELTHQENLKKEEKLKKEDATVKTKWQDKGAFINNKMIKDLKTDLEKSMKEITKELEDKLTVTLQCEITKGNHKEAIMEKIQELMGPHTAQISNPSMKTQWQGPKPQMNLYAYPGMNPFYPGPFG